MSNSNQTNNKAESFSVKQIVGDQTNGDQTKQGIFFEIPSYQRLYEWEKEQIETLLEDVKKACFNAQGELQNKIYFIGNVVVSKQGDRYILIDGQQRLTTLFLIGIYLASEEKNNEGGDDKEKWSKFVKSSKKLRISMPLRENEEKWLSKLIENGLDKGLQSSNVIHQKIVDGIVTIQTWFGQNMKNDLQVFSNFLYQNVRFALVELAEGTDLNQFFVRMNNRGKQLEKHEILKARLLGVLQKQSGENDEWKTYAKIWDLCSDMDKYIFDYSNDRGIIREIMEKSGGEIAKTNNCADKNQPSTLKDIITSSQSAEIPREEDKKEPKEKKVESIIDFPTFLLHVAKLFIVKHCFKNEGPKCNHKLPPINKNKLLEIICIGNQDSCGDEKFTFGTKDKVIDFIDFLLKCRLAFDCFVIKRILDEELLKGDQETGKRYAIGILGCFRNGDKSFEYKISNFTELENLATLQDYLRLARNANQTHHHWLTSFLGSIVFKTEFLEERIKEGENKDSLNIKGYQEHCYSYLKDLDTKLAIYQALRNSDKKNSLIEFIDSNLMESNELKLDIQETWFNNWNEKEGIEFLNQGTGTPHYWFYRLEYYLIQEQGLKNQIEGVCFSDVVKNYRFRYVDSIEHIQPQSKKDGWGNVDIFGNLALVSKDLNSSLNNQEVRDKYQDIVKRVKSGNIQSLKMFLAYASMKDKNGDITWTPDNAKRHQDQMLDILKASLGIQKDSKEGGKD